MTGKINAAQKFCAEFSEKLDARKQNNQSPPFPFTCNAVRKFFYDKLAP